MAQVTVLIYKVITSYSGTYTSTDGALTYDLGDIFHILYDTDTGAFTVQFRTSGSGPGAGSLVTTALSGPPLTGSAGGRVEQLYPFGYDLYKYCEGTTLWQMSGSGNFPYCGKYGVVNSPYCYIAPTCDLEISSEYTATNATGPETNDGSIQVSATSSYGTIKYGIGNFNYSTSGQTSGLFENLLPGVYTVYAKDAAGCQDTITIEVGVTEEYGVRWRLEFDDLNNHVCRLDILERAYTGETEEVCGADDPVEIVYNGDPQDPYKPIVPSECNISLLGDYPNKYVSIFTADDRKYLVKYYINLGSGFELYWTGFCISEFYSEPYLKEPFYIKVTAIDGLGQLESESFLDENGNKFRGDLPATTIIANILKTTGLKLNINSAVNVYELGMDDGDADDPLEQSYIDTRIFYNEDTSNMFDALSNLLLPYGARIYQSKGEWWIQRVEYSVIETMPYRTFTYEGVYSSNASLNLLYQTAAPQAGNRLAWVDRTQLMEFIRNYGTITITHDLIKDQNFIDSGGFERDDLVEDAEGNFFFKDWSFTMGQSGQSFGIEDLEDGTSCFFNQWDGISSDPQNDSVLYTKEIPIKLTLSGQFKINFKVLIIPFLTFPWVRVGWKFRSVDSDSGDFNSIEWNGDVFGYSARSNEEFINDIYIDSSNYGKWQDIELGPFNPGIDAGEGTIQLLLYFHNHHGKDYDDYDDMKARPTEYEDRRTPDQRVYFDVSGVARTISYRLDATDAPESIPDVVRPLDYTGLAPRQWVIEQNVGSPGGGAITKKILIDDVKISFYTNQLSSTGGYVDPPAKVRYSATTSKLVKSTLSRSVILGDVPVFDNSTYIYRGYIKLEDGTPTNKWYRKGVTEEKYLLDILLNDYKTQLSSQTQKLSGTGQSTDVVHYLNFFYNHINGSRYMNTNFVYSAKRAMYSIDVLYIKSGEDGEPPVDLSSFTLGFTVGFNA